MALLRAWWRSKAPLVGSSLAARKVHSIWARRLSTAEAPATRLDGVRGVLRLSGQTSISFLQSLVTNDLRPLDGPDLSKRPRAVYAVLMNAQGRHLHDMHISRTADATPTLLLDVDHSSREPLLKALKRYRLRQAIDMDDVSDSFSVCVGSSSDAHAESWAPDARLPVLGRRAVLPASAKSLPAASEQGAREFVRLRYALGVPEGDSEMAHGEAIPLEYNLDGLHGVSFDKGCYIGQELVARTHFKGVIRKRLFPVRFTPGAAPPGLGDKIVSAPGGAAAKGRAAGVIRAVDASSGSGLALLRLAIALPASEGKGPQLMCGNAAVQPLVPDWWPEEWRQAPQ